MTRGRGLRSALCGAALAVLGSGLTGCAWPEASAPSVSPEASEASEAPEATASPDDAAFVAMMAEHHDQAVALAELADGRAGDPALAELAATIAVTQRAEAAALRAWLDRRGIDAAAHHDAGVMPGALSTATMERAEDATGEEFDRVFADAMIRHHEGAIEMAEERLSTTGDPAVARLARTIATTQGVEIDRLRELAPAG